MLVDPGSRLFIYAVTRDLGFAPNPFHGVCSLATCKPAIRSVAAVNDWIIGIAGAVMGKDKGKCVYVMKVTEKISVQEYWEDERFVLKRPVRNGSMAQTLGDNIYHYENGLLVQEDSHHSNPDGSPNLDNIKRDTGRTDSVLVSNIFIYFGKSAIPLPLESIGYRKVRGHRNIDLDIAPAARKMIGCIYDSWKCKFGLVLDDPFHFEKSRMRVNQSTGAYR